MSSPAKVLDPAFHAVGQRIGTEIWRIVNFQPVAVPKPEHGKFYSGDSYIILQTSSRGTGFLYDIYFWLGKDTSQDEAGTAAIKSVELDAALGGRAVQHREVQGHESDKFLSCFRPCIIPLEGGFASGFKKVEEEAYESRLFTCRGKRVVKMKQVPFARSSLNHDDVFILDTSTKIYQFNGSNSNIQERAKALEVVQFLKDTYHHGTVDVAIVDDGKLDTESDSGAFWVLLGGFAPLSRKVVSEEDLVPERSSPKLFSISEGEVKILECELTKGNLENNKCYLLDCGDEIYVWIGRVTQLEERKTAIQAAEDFIAQNRPKSVRVTRVNQGYESIAFKSNFSTWPVGSVAPGAEEGRGKVAALLKQQGVGLKGASKSVTVNEEVPPLLETGGKIEVWQVNGKSKIPISKEDIGKFYSGDCYLVLYTYHLGDKKEEYFLCYWIGSHCVEADREAASRLANTTFNSLKGRPVLGRIFQGKEPPQFIALFPHMIILKGGISSGYKDHVALSGLQDETYTPECTALFCVSGTSVHNNKVLQVDASAMSLNSSDCYLLQSGSSMFSWHGNQSNFEQHQLAAKVAEFLKPGVTLKLAKEGTESSSFWLPLGGKQSYTSKKAPPEVVRDPRLYTFTLNQEDLRVEEVYNFSQDDLLPEDILILNTQQEVFVWIGQCVNPNEKQNAFNIGQKFLEKAASVESMSPQVPLYKVSEGVEPVFFTTFFSWDPVKASIQGNSLHKKMTLLFGTSNQPEEDKSNGQGGPTQRASALAALNSAFNSSAGKSGSSSNERSNGSNKGGPTQRASALAALNSAFKSPSDSKTAPRRSTGRGQGSQRAAAVAALSSVLTAEQKTSSPESDKKKSTPPQTPEPEKIERSPSPSPSEGSFTGDSKTDFQTSKSDTSDAAEHVEEPECAVNSIPPEDSGENDGKDESSPKAIGYDQLKVHSDNPVSGIDFQRREAYLSDEEFFTIFGSSKDAFYKLPKWKQDLLKKKLDLF